MPRCLFQAVLGRHRSYISFYRPMRRNLSQQGPQQWTPSNHQSVPQNDTGDPAECAERLESIRILSNPSNFFQILSRSIRISDLLSCLVCLVWSGPKTTYGLHKGSQLLGVSVCLSVRCLVGRSVGRSACLSAGLSGCLSICLSVCLSLGLSPYLSVCLSCLFVCLSSSRLVWFGLVWVGLAL